MGVAATGTMCAKPAHTRVAPGDPEGSLLYAKLAVTMDCGLAMPEGEGPPPSKAELFDAEQLQIVWDWIAGGARDR